MRVESGSQMRHEETWVGNEWKKDFCVDMI